MEDLRVRGSPRAILLSCADVFQSLTPTERLYAHHMSKAAWLGTRIILRQVSPESTPIFNFILELYHSCSGDWSRLSKDVELTNTEMRDFLDFAAVFLQNIGNYSGRGDRKFVPHTTLSALEKLSKTSAMATKYFDQIREIIARDTPVRLGFTDQISQTSYYIGLPMKVQEVELVSDAVSKRNVQLENTRISKQGESSYEILIASVEKEVTSDSTLRDGSPNIHVVHGDHSTELGEICDCLTEAKKYVSNSFQRDYITKLQASFQTGEMELYKEAQRLWVQTRQPAVETILGFVEPYRDPYGVRAEFEGLVGIVHKQETELLNKLVQNADQFIATLPWVPSTCAANSRGPFEVVEMGYRDFTSIHTLAYCSTVIFEGINLPNYNDIRQNAGSKNVLIPGAQKGVPFETYAEMVPQCDKEVYLSHCGQAEYFYVVFHELFGHGTGRFLEEDVDGVLNFDPANPPTNPVTNEPIDSWYREGQTYTQAFGDIATSVDECRAECVSAYLFGNKDLLKMCGFTDETNLSASNLEYTLYMQIAIDGLESLKHYSDDGQKWGQAHARAHFAMLRTLLETCKDFMSIEVHPTTESLTVKVDRSRIATHGRPAIGLLALKLHIFRCTADAKRCRNFYEVLTTVSEPYSSWRRTIMARKQPTTIYVQPNTFLEGDTVVFKEYPATVEGMIKSWADRQV